MTQQHPTPTTHGAWRVTEDGRLINEDEQQASPATDAAPPAADSKPANTHRTTSRK